jgi:hypothetical protein
MIAFSSVAERYWSIRTECRKKDFRRIVLKSLQALLSNSRECQGAPPIFVVKLILLYCTVYKNLDKELSSRHKQYIKLNVKSWPISNSLELDTVPTHQVTSRNSERALFLCWYMYYCMVGTICTGKQLLSSDTLQLSHYSVNSMLFRKGVRDNK